MDGGQDHIFNRVDPEEPLHIDVQQTVAAGSHVYPAFADAGQFDPRPGSCGRDTLGGVIFMDQPLRKIKNIQVFFADPQKVADIFCPDNVSFTKGPSLFLAGDDFGDIVAQNHSHGILDGDG
jgi:hypothetical protein